MSTGASQYIREALHLAPSPPPIIARFFYTSPIPIDDPLSPLPPPATAIASNKQPPKPFSRYDNDALDGAWHELRQRILKHAEELGEKSQSAEANRARSASGSIRHGERGSESRPATPRAKAAQQGGSSLSQQVQDPSAEDETAEVAAESPTVIADVTSIPDTTGNPFVKMPSRHRVPRPKARTHDTYQWEDPSHLAEPSLDSIATETETGPSAQVAVGISRLHQVEMPNLQMTPIYWTPVHDTAQVVRATWFYQDTMLPVETDVANMLESGYVSLQCWSETWKDELDSAVSVGAAGEMRIVHKLWPEDLVKPSDSRQTSQGRNRAKNTRTYGEDLLRAATLNLADTAPQTDEQMRDKAIEAACDIIDISTGPGGSDNKASGTNTYGNYGTQRKYTSWGVIYTNDKEARLLKPSLLPSDYYGRRPLANYIRKDYKLGIRVVRGFDQRVWDRLHPSKAGSERIQAEQGTATSASGVPPNIRAKSDPSLARAERPQVTDLIFVIHGIGQKLSERMESFHFTHAINSFRREINVEMGSKESKALFRKDMGGIMVLPINWRHALSFEEGGYRNDDDGIEGLARNHFSLDDITPETLPSIRNIVSDVMLDIPYYMSEHQPKMIAAVVREANRVYRLWCHNNPGFAEGGRVHIIAHSLGSVMSIDILSRQPTTIPANLTDPTAVDLEAERLDHFLFNTSHLYLAGSPAGFFLLLKKAQLLPRLDHPSVAALTDPTTNRLAICGERGQYGCIPVDNVYNIINPYDPVAYRMNAAVDVAYSGSIRQAIIPSATPGWFGVGTKSTIIIGGSSAYPTKGNPTLPRLPSNVELETHDFTREEVAEKRMILLNDNGQIDFFLRYGGGAFSIQYLTMLGAHSSYWLLKDFVRMIVTETAREKGRDGTFLGMRAAKKRMRGA